MLKFFAKRRRPFTILMKSGSSFVVLASDCKIERNTQTGQLTSYNFDNVKPGTIPLYIHLDQVEGILY